MKCNCINCGNCRIYPTGPNGAEINCTEGWHPMTEEWARNHNCSYYVKGKPKRMVLLTRMVEQRYWAEEQEIGVGVPKCTGTPDGGRGK